MTTAPDKGLDWLGRCRRAGIRLTRRLLDPRPLRVDLLEKLLPWPFEVRLNHDLLPYPAYAYGLALAARHAARLGYPAISAIEFGVAAGRGLMNLEQHAEKLADVHKINIEVYGFDTGRGLPPPRDYRDLPFIWRSGYYPMNGDALRTKLRKAQLLIGNVDSTIEQFSAFPHAPVGFVSFDLDLYSSTIDALRLFDAAASGLAPRVFCYFDDLVGKDDEIFCEWTGELLAINEYNRGHESRKLGPISGLRWKRPTPRKWCEQMYALHVFDHPQYCDLILDDSLQSTRSSEPPILV
jgi:hypothetical protein